MTPLKPITRSETETTRLGNDIAMVLKPGDMICLSGDLGVGKSVLARGIIRQLAGQDDFEVPSPTYTLCQTYETSPAVAHFDLYRISGMDELEELGLEDALETGCALIEWPEQCFETIPEEALHIEISQKDETERHLTFTGNAEILSRIKRSLLIREFLEEAGCKGIQRRPMSGDASARSYELITHRGDELLVMNAPALPDGPPIKDGKPYSRIAHLAEDVTAFVAIDELIRKKGFAAPKIKSQDLDEGLLLIEHFGNDFIIDADRVPIAERYMASIEFLAKLHAHSFGSKVKLASGQSYQIPAYDEEAILIEADLLLQWYAPAHSKTDITNEQADVFVNIWRKLANRIKDHEQTLVLRDFHSPNIIWRDQESGTDRIGVIDFQDAVIGPASYDVASLAQDARVDVSEELETQLVNHYIKCRKSDTSEFNEQAFLESYAIMATQRATKLLGIFIRLDKRDGKPTYLQHLPRTQTYIKRSLRHPILNEYREWLESVIKL